MSAIDGPGSILSGDAIQNDFTEYEPCGFREGNCPIHDVDHVALRDSSDT